MTEQDKINNLERELVLFKEKYYSLLENIRESVAIYKAVDEGNDFVFTYFNKSAEKLEQLSQNDVIGKRVTDVFPSVKEFGLLAVMQDVWKSGKSQYHPIHQYQDERILGWRDNYVFKLGGEEVVAAYLDRTEEQKALKELEQVKILFLQSLNQSPIGVLIVNIGTGKLHTINKVVLKIIGRETEEGLNIDNIEEYLEFSDENETKIQFEDLLISRALQGITTENQSIIIKRYSDGKKIWCDISSGPVSDDSGKLIAASLFFSNISEDQTFKYKMKMLSKFPEENPNPIIRFTKDGQVVFFNEASKPLLDFWNYSEGYIHSQIILSFIQSLEKSKSKNFIDIEIENLTYSVFFVLLENTPYINAYALDVTDREISAKQLLQIQSRYYNLFHNMLDGYAYHKIIVDSSGIPVDFEFLEINPAFSRLTHLNREKLIRKKITEIIPSVFGETSLLIKNYGEVALYGKEISFESYLESLDKYFAISVYSPEPEHFVTVFRDISENIKAKNELKALNEELEERVKLRTTGLSAVNKELESFSYSVSHDLRAPLRGIDGFSQALLEDYSDSLDETAKNYLNRIRSGVQRMGTLINDLLQLSRLTRMEAHYNFANISALAHEIVEELKIENPTREIEIIIEENLIEKCDLQLIRVVLQNLIGNAWKFTNKTPNPRIQFKRNCENGKNIYFVKDNGAGFDMAYSQKLFGAFQRLHSMQEFEGTGIGLATVQRIIHKHGGEVWAEGKVGKGATIYFTFQ